MLTDSGAALFSLALGSLSKTETYMFRVDIDTDPLWLRVYFQYNEEMVSLIRRVYGRMWDKQLKCWKIPIHQIDEFRRLSTIEKFSVEFTPEAGKLVNRFFDFCDHANALKTREAESEGLYPPQARGVAYGKYVKRFLLGDEMGLGKTVQSLRIVRDSGGQALIVVEANTLRKWGREIEKHVPDLSWQIIAGAKSDRDELWLRAAENEWDAVLCSYEILRNDVIGPESDEDEAPLFESVVPLDWDWIICDEAAAIKSPNSKRSRAVHTLNSRGRIALTGTPIEKHSLFDWYGIFAWLLPNYLGNWWQFQSRFAVKNFWGGIDRWRDIETVRDWCKPFFLARRKSDPAIASQLPPYISMRVDVELTPRERDLVKQIDENYRLWLDDSIEHWEYKASEETKLLRVRQFLSSPSFFYDDAPESKIEKVKDLLENYIPEEDKVLIFTEFATYIAPHIAEELDALLITGATPDKDDVIQSFQSDPSHRVLVCTDALKRGHDLFSANWIIHCDLPWAGGTLTQREGRVHRFGQTKPVTAIRLVVPQTADDAVERTCLKGVQLNETMLTEENQLSLPLRARVRGATT